jgi:hypothetical protein
MRTREEMIAEMKGKTVPTVEVLLQIHCEILMTEKNGKRPANFTP